MIPWPSPSNGVVNLHQLSVSGALRNCGSR